MNAAIENLRALPLAELLLLLGMPIYFLAFFAFFMIRSALFGFPRSARFEKMAKLKVVPRPILEYGYFMLNSQVKLAMALGITADAMTLLSLLLAVAGACYIGAGRFGVGGWLMFYSFFCDAFDGIIARKQGTASARGEYFDSFIDRYADTITGFGFLYYYRNDPIPAVIVCLMIAGSNAMGYARAKGEAVGIDPNVGVMQRHERAAWLGVLTVLAPIFSAFLEPGAAHPLYYSALVALALIAVLTNVSAVWRAAYVMRRMPKSQTTIPVEQHATEAEQAAELDVAAQAGLAGGPASATEPHLVRP